MEKVTEKMFACLLSKMEKIDAEMNVNVKNTKAWRKI
jgi:hypothetical protein